MPNLLKSLPREILDKEDSKFIYNVLNPLLFEKIRENNIETLKSYTVSEMLDKDINKYEQFDANFRIPYNIDSRSFHVYMGDGQEKIKLENYRKEELILELDEIKEFIFFYFSVEGYGFIKKIIEKYYFIKNEVEKNKKLYKTNYDKYIISVDVKKKKVFKQTFEYFKEIYDEFNLLLTEFDVVFRELSLNADYSVNQLVDNIASSIGDLYKIRTFDNDIVFTKSKLFAYLSNNVNFGDDILKHTFSGKEIIGTKVFQPNNIIELMSIFALELYEIKAKYSTYLSILVDNNGMGYSLKRSSEKFVKNKILNNIILDLDSDNLTYFINEENNELEIYLYFDRVFRIEESTLKIKINDRNYERSIVSLNGHIHNGYTMFDYFDDTTKYYKITIHNYLVKDLDDEYVNFNIDNIELEFDAVESVMYAPTSSNEPLIETTGFLDNFVIYKKNSSSGFYERFDIPYKIKINIDEKEERYNRIYEFMGINAGAQQAILDAEDILISCYSFDYMYEPKLYVDFFKDLSNTIELRYHTIVQYTLIDDVIDKDFEIPYYSEIEILEYNSNIKKNVLMYDGKVYRRIFDNKGYMQLVNPYNEPNNNFVSKISYDYLDKRDHVRDILITEKVEKLPFYANLKFLEPYQYDKDRNCIIIFYMNNQYVIPLDENLVRNNNYEQITYDPISDTLFYASCEKCSKDFIYANEKIYIHNDITDIYDELELVSTELINLSETSNRIYYDIFTMKHAISIGGEKFNLTNLYLASNEEALKYVNQSLVYVEKKFGIPRFKSIDGNIYDIEFANGLILKGETEFERSLIYDVNNNTIEYKHNQYDSFFISLEIADEPNNYHRLAGLNVNSIFYAGNAMPENSNKSFYGRENIMSSLTMPDDVYNIGRSSDTFNNLKQHKLLGEQLDLNVENASKHNMEQEPYLMFKSSTSSLKGLESYLKSNLKSISQDIEVSPVYLVQRNRFISEWARVSSVLPTNSFAENSLKELVADLMETKLINGVYDDLIDIFKNNEYEKFSLDTNNIHGILVQYIRRYLEDEFLLEDLNYYLIHSLWMDNNRKKVLDFIKSVASEKVIKMLSSMSFNANFEKEKLFYTFIEELEKVNKTTIESYKPIANYSDWLDYEENNKVKFEKPFRYDIIDITDFITMPIDWKQPLVLIRPLTEDGVFTKRDYRFLDSSIATNSQITYDDSYNEYVEDIKNKLNKPVNYLDETLRILQDLSLEGEFDFLGVNLVIVKWIVERFLPNYILSNEIGDVTTFREIVKNELLSSEHPNLIVSYNKIKESILLRDLGSNVNEIYESITSGELVVNSYIRLDITDNMELEYLDKIKRPAEHYFDFLFGIGRHDIITKILALFTEDVIASSMLDLSFAINIKNSKGDETYDIYEKMIYELFDEFLPFHSVLDKIIFTIKIMETNSAEAISKQAEVETKDEMLIDIFTKFAEKVRIQTFDRAIVSSKISALFPSEGLKLCGGHDEIPYDFDRKIKVGGHDVPMHMDDSYGVDDDWYIVNRDSWKERPQDIYTPPEFADLLWSCIPENEFEKVADVYLDDYYHIKQNIFERDDRIESYFVDSLQAIGVGYNLDENPDINVTEDYLIAIDSTFNIRFYDMENMPHDEYGLDEAWGPEDQTTLIGAKENMYQTIMQEFYDKINVSVMDSVWTDIKVLYDLTNIPGHDEFAVDEYYHQLGPDRLGQEISTMVYDDLLHQGFGITANDMSDISLIDKELAIKSIQDSKLFADARVTDDIHVTIDIWAGRSSIEFLTPSGVFVPPGHDEFAYDEFYHDSADLDRVANMTDTTLYDALGIVRVDFGFMRMLPIDPYQDLIDQKFYRADQPGSEFQKTKVKDTLTSDVRIFGKDIIRVSTLDMYMLDIIDEELRREIYSNIENDTLTGDYFAAELGDVLTKRHIHHDFRENIVALEKYASVLDDETILGIFGPRAAQIERDKLFELRIGDSLKNDIKLKIPVDRSLTQIDKDYLKEIRIEEEDYVEYKHVEYELDVRFKENLLTYYQFNEKAVTSLNETVKTIIKQMNQKESLETTTFDKVHYGSHHNFDIDGMHIGLSDRLVESWQTKIHKDSMVLSVTDDKALKTSIDVEYEFKEERILQPHDLYGHMGYTDESLQRSIESKLTDSLIQHSEERFEDKLYTHTYDMMMHDIHHHYGDYLDVILSDSIHTYIHIVKKPWIFPEFDEFGHNEYPHMYNGDSDEFDITTELRDQLKIDANAFLYNVGALVQFNENLLVGQHWDMGKDDIISASVVDDLKVINIGFKDDLDVNTNDVTRLQKTFYEQPTNISIQDTVWYGYKLRDEWLQIETKDQVDYGYEDMVMHDVVVNVGLKDWLLMSYGFNEGKATALLDDKILSTELGTLVSDEVSVAFKETLRIDDFQELFYKDDVSKVGISDSVTVTDEIDLSVGLERVDNLDISITERLEYGEGKWFHEVVRGYIQNRLSIYDGDLTYPPNLMVDLEDSFHEYTTIAPFKDSLGVQTYERLKYGLIFKDSINAQILRDNHLFISRKWEIDRYGVNDVIHDRDGYGMEYPDDVSADNSFATLIQDDIKIIEHMELKDTLDLISADRLSTADESNMVDVSNSEDGIVISNVDNLMYGIGKYDYIWDAKEWEHYGYSIPYEEWTGHIPHDDFPYDEMEHQDQGEDLSQIVTGVTENLLYGFDFIFKDTINIQTVDSGGFETWGYQSVFKETAMVYVDNRLESSWADTDDNTTMIEMRKEQMRVSYDFDDTIKEHIFTRNGIISQELINIYDIDTLQLIEQIYKYRIYETLDTQINDNLFTTSLFKYDDELSLVTDYKTKIDLYTEQSDGSVTKSMTLIKDKTTARVELLFGDVINTNVKDKLQGTYANRPNEYLE